MILTITLLQYFFLMVMILYCLLYALRLCCNVHTSQELIILEILLTLDDIDTYIATEK